MPFNDTTSPRLGETTTFTLKWLANPDPTILWTHDNKKINHKETGMTTSIEIEDINVTSFGDYILTMNNSYGVYTHIFRIKADGPPDPVSDIEVLNINETSALFEYQPGFNYNNTQWFKIHIEPSNREMDMIVEDTTDGKGDTKQNYSLIGLKSGTDYQLNILAININGFANNSPTVHFRTEEATMTDSIPINIRITITVCVCTGLVIISMFTVLIYRKRKRSNAQVAYLSSGEVGGRTNSKDPNTEFMHERE
ncbi:uncharacterized protein LOC127863470 isoform X2 [Dreissena polymorpha]|uniref:uncharacterized protein LOC127863470 isoform X2 n=1 Tax=Dreissena polymorpha TaxID=45954 RepID=UPI002263F078|nr:uncharacterized protein LOC127863470 isoform X2 [Dreissena polymorpha]